MPPKNTRKPSRASAPTRPPIDLTDDDTVASVIALLDAEFHRREGDAWRDRNPTDLTRARKVRHCIDTLSRSHANNYTS